MTRWASSTKSTSLRKRTIFTEWLSGGPRPISVPSSSSSIPSYSRTTARQGPSPQSNALCGGSRQAPRSPLRKLGHVPSIYGFEARDGTRSPWRPRFTLPPSSEPARGPSPPLRSTSCASTMFRPILCGLRPVTSTLVPRQSRDVPPWQGGDAPVPAGLAAAGTAPPSSGVAPSGTRQLLAFPPLREEGLFFRQEGTWPPPSPRMATGSLTCGHQPSGT